MITRKKFSKKQSLATRLLAWLCVFLLAFGSLNLPASTAYGDENTIEADLPADSGCIREGKSLHKTKGEIMYAHENTETDDRSFFVVDSGVFTDFIDGRLCEPGGIGRRCVC